MRASWGSDSLKWTPGTLVAIVPSVPRTPSGASGLGSKESMWVTPPAIQSRRTELALPEVVGAAPMDWPGQAEAARANDPTRNTSLRLHRAARADGDRPDGSCP